MLKTGTILKTDEGDIMLVVAAPKVGNAFVECIWCDGDHIGMHCFVPTERIERIEHISHLVATQKRWDTLKSLLIW